MHFHPLALAAVCRLLVAVRASPPGQYGSQPSREYISINSGWKFHRWESNPDGVIYDQRPDLVNLTDVTILKPWILPSGNDFIANVSQRHQRPSQSPNVTVPYALNSFNDDIWETVDLPHDWAIAGPFYTDDNGPAIVGGGMGRLPVFGVGWYRRQLEVSHVDLQNKVYLEVDGAMSYAMVWVNGELVGGWPYPYNSWRLDLTPYLRPGEDNILAIRMDNPNDSARWYPGGGLYRNVWLTKVQHTRVAQWGTRFTSRDVSTSSALIDVDVVVINDAKQVVTVTVDTVIYQVSAAGQKGDKVASLPKTRVSVGPDQSRNVSLSVQVRNPRLWGPPPSQTPNLYVGVTRILNQGAEVMDTYKTTFGIRDLQYTGSDGLRINGQRVRVQGVNAHHDLGAIGAAFNVAAARRRLDTLRDLGVNAIRMSHNPPDPQLLDMCDQYGFVVMDEVFDSWYRPKTTNDFSLIFGDWHEQDLRAMIRRDANHPSVALWSVGNEVGEQSYTDELRTIATMLHGISHDEDHTRPITASMNAASPNNAGFPFPEILDVLSINYQGEGIRDTPNFSNLSGSVVPPAYPIFHNAYPDKLLWESESAATVDTRGTYFFPITGNDGAPVNDSSGGNSTLGQVSAYGLYASNFGAPPDKVFRTQDQNPYVGGEFVWSGPDYIGEPTPYYSAKSSYYGIIDLAGFPKDRYYLYQSRWRPSFPMAHILPHWNWPDREGEVTPVHVFTSGDSAELFLNGKSMGRLRKGEYDYRLRWDNVTYTPGTLHVVAYKNAKQWAQDTVYTSGPAVSISLAAERKSITADGQDLAYITADIIDTRGHIVPTASNEVQFTVSEGGQIVATDNGEPEDLLAFPSTRRRTFSGKALLILKATMVGNITVTASSDGLSSGRVALQATSPLVPNTDTIHRQRL